MAASRFVVGIDLGTTNNGVAYVDTGAAEADDARASDLAVPQVVGPGSTAVGRVKHSSCLTWAVAVTTPLSSWSWTPWSSRSRTSTQVSSPPSSRLTATMPAAAARRRRRRVS